MAIWGIVAALSTLSFPAHSDMYVCKRSDGSSVLRNMACAPQERTASINGLSPQEWERRSAEKRLMDARALEEATRQAEVMRRTASTQGSEQATTLGGFADAARKLGEGLKAVVDPSGAALNIMEANKPRPR